MKAGHRESLPSFDRVKPTKVQLAEATAALQAHAELPLDENDEHFLQWYIKLLLNNPHMEDRITLPDSHESFDLPALRLFFRDQLGWWAALEHVDVILNEEGEKAMQK